MRGPGSTYRRTMVRRTEDLCDSPGLRITLNCILWKQWNVEKLAVCIRTTSTGIRPSQEGDCPQRPLLQFPENGGVGRRGENSPRGVTVLALLSLRPASVPQPAGFKSVPEQRDTWPHITPYPATRENKPIHARLLLFVYPKHHWQSLKEVKAELQES